MHSHNVMPLVTYHNHNMGCFTVCMHLELERWSVQLYSYDCIGHSKLLTGVHDCLFDSKPYSGVSYKFITICNHSGLIRNPCNAKPIFTTFLKETMILCKTIKGKCTPSIYYSVIFNVCIIPGYLSSVPYQQLAPHTSSHELRKALLAHFKQHL